jgi:H+-transporting ATPase
VKIEIFSGFNESDVILFGALASREEDKDPIDDTIMIECRSMKEVSDALGTYRMDDFKPFDPVVICLYFTKYPKEE